jgi:hypothetical protein
MLQHANGYVDMFTQKYKLFYLNAILPCRLLIVETCMYKYLQKHCQAFQLHGYLYTLYFFSLFWRHVFFAFQHNLGTFCRGELLKLSLNK